MVIGNNRLLNIGGGSREGHHIDTLEMDQARLNEGQNGIYFTVYDVRFFNTVFIDIFFLKHKNSTSVTLVSSFHNFFF